MVLNNEKVLEHWNKEDVKSMPDKHLINAEIRLIKVHIPIGAKILDAGCGEGEGTFEYSKVKGVKVHAVDYSQTRLDKAKVLLKGKENVTFTQVDLTDSKGLNNDYDVIITQRCLINLMEWELQEKVINDLMSRLKKGGKFLMLEGNQDGVNELNTFRKIFNLSEIPVQWHNKFLRNDSVNNVIKKYNYILEGEYGLGEYFLLTRGIRPIFSENLDWDNSFNEVSAKESITKSLDLNTKFSRLKLWIISK
jgi:ubiquinone/menaquinone biosynthesis C-methylase UbiE